MALYTWDETRCGKTLQHIRNCCDWRLLPLLLSTMTVPNNKPYALDDTVFQFYILYYSNVKLYLTLQHISNCCDWWLLPLLLSTMTVPNNKPHALDDTVFQFYILHYSNVKLYLTSSQTWQIKHFNISLIWCNCKPVSIRRVGSVRGSAFRVPRQALDQLLVCKQSVNESEMWSWHDLYSPATTNIQ